MSLFFCPQSISSDHVRFLVIERQNRGGGRGRRIDRPKREEGDKEKKKRTESGKPEKKTTTHNETFCDNLKGI